MPKNEPLAHLDAELKELERRGLLRAPAEPETDGALSFCSNDYLGLAASLVSGHAAGAGASRLIAGERREHGELEADLARYLGVEAALVFTSGYAANVGALSSLVGPEDLVVSDALNHASLIDGLRLARAAVKVVRHADVDAMRATLAGRSSGQRAWVVVESYYSMDADGPDLAALREVCDEASAALYVDEAHALGVMGPGGAGLCAEAGITPDVVVGTLGKSLGAQGAFVAGGATLRAWLWNRARSFVFSTGVSPALAAAARVALVRVQSEAELRERVSRAAARLRSGITGAGVRSVLRVEEREDVAELVVLGRGHVVPVVAGTEARALRLADGLRRRGIGVRAVRPPTVPEGTSRVRFTVTARHTDEDIDRAVDAFREAVTEL